MWQKVLMVRTSLYSQQSTKNGAVHTQEAEGVLLAKDQYIIGIGPNRKEYSIYIASVGGRTFFTEGWESFLQGNNMVEGTALLCSISDNGTRLTAQICDGNYRVKPIGNWQLGNSSHSAPPKNRRGTSDRHGVKDPPKYSDLDSSDDDSSDEDEPPTQKPFCVALLRANINRGLVLENENKWRSPPKGYTVVITGPGNQKSTLVAKRSRNCLGDGWNGFKKLYGLSLGDVLEFTYNGNKLEWNMKILKGAALHRVR